MFIAVNDDQYNYAYDIGLKYYVTIKNRVCLSTGRTSYRACGLIRNKTRAAIRLTYRGSVCGNPEASSGRA